MSEFTYTILAVTNRFILVRGSDGKRDRLDTRYADVSLTKGQTLTDTEFAALSTELAVGCSHSAEGTGGDCE